MPLSNLWFPTPLMSRPEEVHGLDRGLIMKERRHQRARADEIAGRDHHGCSDSWRGARRRGTPGKDAAGVHGGVGGCGRYGDPASCRL